MEDGGNGVGRDGGEQMTIMKNLWESIPPERLPLRMPRWSYKQILGIEGNLSIATDMSVWDGVVVSPLERLYERPSDRK